MIDFIIKFRFEIMLILEIVVMLVLWLVRKRPSINRDDRIQVIIDDCLDYYIKLAEASVVGAREKLLFVVSHVIQRIKHYFPSFDEEYWRSIIVDRVESTLSTPQKKG